MTAHYKDLVQQLGRRPSCSGRPSGGAYREGRKRRLDLMLILAALPFVLPVLASWRCSS